MGSKFHAVCDGRNREAWLKARREGIGGSDSSSALGINPYSSRLDLFTEKMGVYDDPENPFEDQMPSEAARWGHILEPIVLREFKRKFPDRRVKRDGRLLRSRARPWQMCTLDAKQRDDDREGIGLLEIKTTKFTWERIPPDLWCQVQHQFAVTGYEWGSFAVWNRDSCLLDCVDIEPDYEYIEKLNETELEFWQCVLRGEAPDSAGSEACAKALAALYPAEVEGKTVDLGPDFVETFEGLTKAKAAIKGWEQKKRELEQSVKFAMADAEIARLIDGSSFTLRQQTRKASQVKTATFRVLRQKEA